MANCLCFGDSITFGEYDGIAGGWVEILKRWSYTQFNHHDAKEYNIFNLGIGGETTDGLVKRFSVEAAARKSQEVNLIFLSYGANDLAELNGSRQVPLERFRENLEQAVNQAKTITDKIYIISVLPVAAAADGIRTSTGKLRDNRSVAEYNATLAELAERYSATFVDLYTVFYSKKEFLISKDGVHPNAEGYQFIAEQIRPLLEPYF